jgi:hypothetical protein
MVVASSTKRADGAYLTLRGGSVTATQKAKEHAPQTVSLYRSFFMQLIAPNKRRASSGHTPLSALAMGECITTAQ